MLTRQEITDWLNRISPVDDTYVAEFGAAYDPDIRELEAVSRALWGHIPAAAGAGRPFGEDPAIQRFYQLVRARRLPPVDRSRRQIVVETAAISYFLGLYGDQLAADLGDSDMAYLVQWLNTINTVQLPAGNWYFFVIMLNTALKKHGYPYSATVLADALAKIDSYYIGDGWYTDGPTHQMDYYLGFAFHFYGLLYAQLVDDEHAKNFITRAQAFVQQYIYWFDAQGRSIPFGRSLTYRFAPVGFWSQFYLSGAYQGTAFSPAIIKGLIDRSVQYWAHRPITLSTPGPLSVGYGYNNYLLSEDYNAPGSPMWAFNLFTILELPAADPYWQLPAAGYPALPARSNQTAGGMQFIVDPAVPQHVFLASKQFPIAKLMYHGQEKYGKFAYSSHFGFNLSRDTQYIQQFAIDNALAFSIAGQDQFTSRRVIDASQMYADYAVSVWHTTTAQVVTYLVPLTATLHVRIHEVTTTFTLDTYEGGFPLAPWNPKHQTPATTAHSTSAVNREAVSTITDLLANRQPTYVDQGPNTNLISPEKNVVPALYTQLTPGRHILACAVLGDPRPGMALADTDVRLSVTTTGYAVHNGAQTVTIPRYQ